MAGHQQSESERIFLENMQNYSDQSLAAFLFPIDGSEAFPITQAITKEVRSSKDLKQRVNKAFLLLMKGYGFHRHRVIPSVRILLRPLDSKTVDWKTQTWISDDHPEHDRIARMIRLLRIFGHEDVAQAFFTALTSERITDKVGTKSQLLWKAALDQDIAEYLVEENNESTDSSDQDTLFNEIEPLSSEQQVFLERLVKEGTRKFAGKKRSREEEAGNDKGPPSKRQKNDPATWDRVREWLESYRNPESALPWTEELNQRMEVHRKAFNAKPEPERKEFKLPYTTSEVAWAIGSLWAALRPTRNFGYGGSGLFESGVRQLVSEGSMDPAKACGQRHEHFLMPMFFPSQSQEQHPDLPANIPGHLIFALAEKTLDNHDDVVIHAYNSLPTWFHDMGKNADVEIKAEAQAILHMSNWLARRDASEQLRNRPYNVTVKAVTVPGQGSLELACGLHSVLVAWAVLLGIPLQEQGTRGGTLREQPFLTLGKEIVNLAVAGCMDSRTIQAFLNISGMVTEQDVNDKSVRLEVVNTCLMNDVKLDDIVIADGTLD